MEESTVRRRRWGLAPQRKLELRAWARGVSAPRFHGAEDLNKDKIK